jgi:epoxyqueuosine reductase QueG
MENDLFAAVRSFGASDVACSRTETGSSELPYAVSVVVRLSDAIVDEIAGEPTYTYFNHYRSVNYLIDQILLRTGLWLQSRDARYVTVAASQSRPDSPFEARHSHKRAACCAGLGLVGRNGLFLHREWGPRVRLGTLFTDWPLCAPLVVEAGDSERLDPACASCGRCVAACPAHALDATEAGRSGSWFAGVWFDAKKCSDWMKSEYQHIGRGAVCGICMKVCAKGDIQR